MGVAVSSGVEVDAGVGAGMDAEVDGGIGVGAGVALAVGVVVEAAGGVASGDRAAPGAAVGEDVGAAAVPPDGISPPHATISRATATAIAMFLCPTCSRSAMVPKHIGPKAYPVFSAGG
jgi:hypothetical protein